MNKRWIHSLLAIVLGLIFGAILILGIGKNPVEAYAALLKGGTMNLERIGNTVAMASPLVLTGLSVAFAFKTGLFNIGAAGQMLVGALCATAIGLTFDLPSIILVPMVTLAGILGGSLWAFIPGVLKAKFNVNEVVSTIMMNWIAFWMVYYTIPAYFSGDAIKTESRHLPAGATLKAPWLTDLFNGSFINYGIILAIIAVLLIAFILKKTTLGYQLKAVGFNRYGAEYAGISVNRNVIISMMISGALAGLAGVVQYAGNAAALQTGVLPSQGFDGVAIALLGANEPLGVLGAGLFFGLLYTGKGFMSAMTHIPPEIADTIMATIIYFAATSALIGKIVQKINKKKALKDSNANKSEGAGA